MTVSIQTYRSFRERMGGIRATLFGCLGQLTQGAFIALRGAKMTSDCAQSCQKLARECLRCALSWSVLRVVKEGLLDNEFIKLNLTKESQKFRVRSGESGEFGEKFFVRLILCHNAAIWRQNKLFLKHQIVLRSNKKELRLLEWNLTLVAGLFTKVCCCCENTDIDEYVSVDWEV